MTNTTELAATDSPTAAATAARAAGSLSALRLPQLQSLAAELGIPGTGRMRKVDLLAAIRDHQSGLPQRGGAAAAPAPQSETVQDGAAQNGAAQNGSAQNGAAQNGSAPNGAAQNGAAQNGTSHDAPAQDASASVQPETASSPAAEPVAAPVEGRAPRSRSRRAGAPAGAPATSAPAAESARAESSPTESAPTESSPAESASDVLDGLAAPASPAAEPVREDGASLVPTLEEFTGGRPPRTDRSEPRTDGRPEGRADGERPSRRERARRERVREPDQQVELPVMPVREDAAERTEARGDARPDRQPEARDDRGRTERPDRGERGDRTERADRGDRTERADRGDRAERPAAAAPSAGPDDFDGDGSRRGRRNRYRDRKGRRGTRPDGAPEVDVEVSEDDVLSPVAGILDVLDNYAFIRTSGYLAGAGDVYVSLGQVKKNNLRPGDAVTGAVRQPREGEQTGQRSKFNALVRVDTINGAPPEQARNRPDFTKLTPLYPQDRLRLETEPNIMTTRIIDLMSPLGKGQRGLIVAPPKAGKTMVMQAIANAISTNNPECHLMVVLVDERPEEVTDMQRTVKGEVIASTFDRPASDHTAVAELAIERAKRLVELGNDVVVLLDSLTRLSRAYNISAPASGRILSGGVDASALYPPKRFFGAARNIENGGSLTILASALVETGSKADEVIFEEFKGTGNMEVRLSRQLADKRIFPAVDVPASGTRREEILMSREELATVWKLRRVVTALDAQASIELLLDRLKKTRNNLEFLHQVQSSTPLVERD
ncbi:transcription termination factor Rho [Kineococcus rubinsiae]|uniref:transcription termination factor Rho n=1 Tax=Kineococcus rubinsiae TaxID=2609562 RepID=UPI00142FD430|nr:transcription termination factor Rho [Kineococcus rubinsiae]NIZ92472.1 transcription termination factor Rho [Kineococcus rubinsiae]